MCIRDSNNVIGRVGGLITPLAVGGVVAYLGGDESWRWAFWIGGIPTLLMGIALFFIPDPPRGQYEQQATTGEVINEEAPPPISMGATWQRLTAIRTYRTALAAFAALGFMITSVPVFTNLYLEDRFDLDAFERALVTSIPGFLALGVVPFVASRFDRRYAESPPKALVLMGMLFFPVVVLSPLQMSMPTPTLFAIIGAISFVISSAKFAMIAPVLA